MFYTTYSSAQLMKNDNDKWGLTSFKSFSVKDPLLWTKVSFIALKRRILHRTEVKTLAQCAVHMKRRRKRSYNTFLQWWKVSKEKILHSTGVKWYEQILPSTSCRALQSNRREVLEQNGLSCAAPQALDCPLVIILALKCIHHCTSTKSLKSNE